MHLHDKAPSCAKKLPNEQQTPSPATPPNTEKNTPSPIGAWGINKPLALVLFVGAFVLGDLIDFAKSSPADAFMCVVFFVGMYCYLQKIEPVLSKIRKWGK